jgi:hypothetical protein
VACSPLKSFNDNIFPETVSGKVKSGAGKPSGMRIVSVAAIQKNVI